MKKRSIKALRLNKECVSTFGTMQIQGGIVSNNPVCITFMKESKGDWCDYSAYASCYSPCGTIYGSEACNYN